MVVLAVLLIATTVEWIVVENLSPVLFSKNHSSQQFALLMFFNGWLATY